MKIFTLFTLIMNFLDIIALTKKHENLLNKLKHKDTRAGLLLLISSQWKIYIKNYYFNNYERAYIFFWLNILYFSNLDQISFILTNIESDKLLLFDINKYFFTDDIILCIIASIKNKKQKKIFINHINFYLELKLNIIKKMNIIGRTYKTYRFRQRLKTFIFTNIFIKKYYHNLKEK